MPPDGAANAEPPPTGRIGRMRRLQTTPITRLLVAGDRPNGGLRDLRTEVVLPAPLDAAFAFFADAWNLERITPPWLHFRIRTPRPLTMREGAELEYEIRLHGLPIPWRTRIDVWEPGVRFVDRQSLGPYRWWRHEHRFETVPEGTRIVDHVEYQPRVRWLSGPLVHRDVGRIFSYRRDALLRLFGPTRSC
jgi:ligand-binding SRPBCC domain-containing protein